MKKSNLKRIAYIPDCHFPYEDKKAFGLAMRALRFFRPQHTVILGDFGDFYCVSRHPKNPNRTRDLREEVDGANAGLDEVDAMCAEVGCKQKSFCMGNHEDMLRRYLEERAPELFNLVSVEALFLLKQRGYQATQWNDFTYSGKLLCTHDTGFAGANAHVQSAQAMGTNTLIGHCLPINYEVVTPDGFVPLSACAVGDMVLAYKDGRVVESRVSEVVAYKYTGEMVCFRGNAISQEMTDRHHIYLKTGEYMPVRDALVQATKADLVSDALPCEAADYPVSDTLLRLVIAYAADGSRASEGSIRWHLKKERKIRRLTQLLGEAGSSVDWAPPGKNGGRKTRKLGRAVQLAIIAACPDKSLPRWLMLLSPRQRAIAIHELIAWDGSSLRHNGKDHGSRQFASFKAHERAIVQVLLTQQGILSRENGHNVCFNMRDHAPDAVRSLRHAATFKQVEDLAVGCITTEHQNFFVRTPAGKIELTGNTHRLAVQYGSNIRGKHHVAAMAGWLGDTAMAKYLHKGKKTTGWQHGFAVGYQEENGTVHLQPIPIIDGRCVIAGQLIT